MKDDFKCYKNFLEGLKKSFPSDRNSQAEALLEICEFVFYDKEPSEKYSGIIQFIMPSILKNQGGAPFGNKNKSGKSTVKSTPKSTVKSTPKSTVKSTPKSTVKSTPNQQTETETETEKTKLKNNFVYLSPPSLAEVEAYCQERGLACSKKIYDYYASANWRDSDGKPLRSWKQKIIAVWDKPENKIPMPSKTEENFYL
jgi:hypothetical protein